MPHTRELGSRPGCVMLRFSSRPGGPVTTTIRTKRALRIAAAAVLAGTAALQAARAQQQPGTVSVDVSECVKLTTPEERLACFEKQVAGAPTSPAAPGAAAPSSSAAPASSGSSDDRTRPDIHAVIVELRETVPNAFLITLDNGQVWRQSVPKPYQLRVGDRVRIYFSRWRAYRLTNEELKGFIQVDRAR